MIVSDQYAREKIGAPETAAPDEAELERRTEILLKQNPYADEQDPRNGTGETSPAEGGTGADAKQGPPSGPAQRTRDQTPPSPTPNMAAMIMGAAMMQVDRARELAGNRLWTRAQSCIECKEIANSVPRSLLASALGAEQVQAVIEGHATEASLVAGIGEAFARRLLAWNVNGGWEVQLGQMVEQHARRTLYEREVPPLPPGFQAACDKAVANGGSG